MADRAAIFDLDGTLLNTLEDLHASVNHTLALHGMPIRSRDEIRSFLGNGMQALIHLSCPEGTASELEDRVLAEFKDYYALHGADHTAPYDGIVELLDVLSGEGIRRAVVSNKGDFAVQALVEKYFPGIFDAVVGERQDVRRKPAPDTVNAVMRELELAPKDVVYIGDSEVDIDTARNASIDCLSVSWGFRSRRELTASGATTIVDDINDLAEALLLY